MQELKVIGVENGALLAASEDGDRYRIAIDEVLQSRLRQTQTERVNAPKLSPREVQAHIRSGMSAEDVAAVTGASLDYVRRFEGPVVAEREYIVSSALSVPVHTAIDPDPIDESVNFGSVIRERLASLGATGERWASWKEPGGGWIVKLSFTADEIDHDARWGFEPKKNSLSPVGSEAVALSQQGELKGSLIPRLRAVGSETSVADVSRFDSNAFNFKESLADEILNDTSPNLEAVPYSRSLNRDDAVSKAAIKRAAEPASNMSETADLLESLRRRRGEREAASSTDAAAKPTASAAAQQAGQQHEQQTGGQSPAALRPRRATPPEATVTVTDESSAAPATTPEPTGNVWANQAARAQERTSHGRTTAKRGRASMPSWDEIVFGARTDDDLG
ncbi:septation protein SepH [Cryobacterium sp. PH29-G1]|uniref:septation protein SepH n=1 Tax=Cryobacterium sp. PH29-G1 TaxID=3046211 RepID=UPI0024B98B75|nr:septation protein SepH [Cryobacterium sp. PH29-G1]MDJ0350440.1 septation protein SepH [Cryobacterium sp. PH29-G1]